MKNNKVLVEEIQEALILEPTLKGYLKNIYILVNDGEVILTGSVTKRELKKSAREIVQRIPGINRLIDDLRIEPSTSNRPGVQIDWADARMLFHS